MIYLKFVTYRDMSIDILVLGIQDFIMRGMAVPVALKCRFHLKSGIGMPLCLCFLNKGPPPQRNDLQTPVKLLKLSRNNNSEKQNKNLSFVKQSTFEKVELCFPKNTGNDL